MSVGAVGGAGGASVGTGTGAAAGGAAASSGAVGPEVTEVAASDSLSSPKETSDLGGKEAPPPLDGCGNSMSTQNFITLQNNAVQQVGNCQEPEMDLKKLIELMMAIKLLEALNKNQ